MLNSCTVDGGGASTGAVIAAELDDSAVGNFFISTTGPLSNEQIAEMRAKSAMTSGSGTYPGIGKEKIGSLLNTLV